MSEEKNDAAAKAAYEAAFGEQCTLPEAGLTAPTPERGARDEMARLRAGLNREGFAGVPYDQHNRTAGLVDAKQERHPGREVNLIVDDERVTAATPERDARDETLAGLSDHVSVRFAPAMIAVVEQIAAAEGMTISAWIRREVEREADRREARAEPQPHPALAAAREHVAHAWRNALDPAVRDHLDQALTLLTDAGVTAAEREPGEVE